MVIGKDFSKFSNPKYVNKRGSTMTLVRNDAESAWDIPDSPKQREHSLSFVQENETENESEKKSAPLQEETQSEIPPVTSTEVNVGIEIVPPPRNVARERPKKAKLVKAMELDEDLSDSAFEIVTESDLGKRTDSDMSSGNDSTETHTVSLSFKETFDNRHGNTVSVVTESFDSFASGRAEHRTNSLPPELKGRTGIPDLDMKDGHFTPLSKSMDSELSQINKEYVSSNIKYPFENKIKENDKTPIDTAHEPAQTDTTELSAEIRTNPFDNTNETVSGSYVIVTEKEELSKTLSGSATEIPPKPEESTAPDFHRSSDPFMSGFEEQHGISLDDTNSSITDQEKTETEENAAIKYKEASEDVFVANDSDSNKSRAEQEETSSSETDTSPVSDRQNDTGNRDTVDSRDFEWQSMMTEHLSSDVKRSFITTDDFGIETNIISSQANNESTHLDSIQLSTEISTKHESSDSSNPPMDVIGTFKFTGAQNDLSNHEQDSISAKCENDTANEGANSEENNRPVTRSASLTISKDNLFLDAPPTPMIIVRDSFIHEPEAANPFLKFQENENGLPVISEKSESQSSTRSNSFDFDFVPYIGDSQIIAEKHDNIETIDKAKTIENNDATALQTINTTCSEQFSISKTEESYNNENEKMTNKEEANLLALDSNLGKFNPLSNFEMKPSGFEVLQNGKTDDLQSETSKYRENFESLLERSSGFPELQSDNTLPVEKKEAENYNNMDGLTSSSAAALRPTEDEDVSIGGGPLESFINADTLNDRGDFQPLEIEVNLPEKQPQLLSFDELEDDNAMSVTSPTGISTDSSGISWELISETSPNNADTNPFQTTNDMISNSNNQLDDNNLNMNIQILHPSNLLEFETGASQMPQQVNVFGFEAGDTFISIDDRKASDSSSSKEGDTSWEVIDESNKQTLSGLDNDDDTSFAW